MKQELAIVILNYNTAHLLPTYLPSVVECSDGSEVIFVDNGSTDNSVAYVREHFPQIRIIEFEENYGFTGGYNRALKMVEAEYYCLLNSDVKVCDNWTKRPLEILKNNADVAACQPKLLSYCEENKFEYAGAAGGYIDYLGYPFCAGRIFEQIEEDHLQYEQEREIFWASGAALFVKADLYHQFGGLDERFFAHMEEIDLCWRLKNQSYKIIYTPQSKVYHLGGGTLNKTSPRKTYLNFRNNLLLLYKNLPDSELKAVFLKRRFLDFVAAVVFLLQAKPKECKAVRNAYKDFRKMKKEYPRTKGKITQYPTCVYQKSIVFSSKLFGRKSFQNLQSKDFVSEG